MYNSSTQSMRAGSLKQVSEKRESELGCPSFGHPTLGHPKNAMSKLYMSKSHPDLCTYNEAVICPKVPSVKYYKSFFPPKGLFRDHGKPLCKIRSTCKRRDSATTVTTMGGKRGGDVHGGTTRPPASSSLSSRPRRQHGAGATALCESQRRVQLNLLHPRFLTPRCRRESTYSV